MNKIKIPWARNYLRMRGEEIQLASEHVQELELPPHARRRVFFGFLFGESFGITSACAEKSRI